MSNKLKYQEYLFQFPDCPPANCLEMNGKAFRWVHDIQNVNDFQPLNLINEPPQRILDDTDRICMGYGLSLFDSFDNAINRYKILYNKLRQHLKIIFIVDKGACISALHLHPSDGIAGQISNHGHFTFHEYVSADLRLNVDNIMNIFTEDGKFII